MSALEEHRSGRVYANRLPCPNCRELVAPKVYSSGPHLRADCPGCGRYLKFVPKREPWLTLLEVTA